MPAPRDDRAPDPDRTRRFRRKRLPDLRSITVRDALRRIHDRPRPDADQRDALEDQVRERLRTDEQ